MSRSNPTIVEVAEAASVAVSTVSRVVNGGSASEKVQARVEEAILKLGYVPSAAARNLKLGKTGIVGIGGATTGAAWFTELLEGMEDILAKHASSVAICGWQKGDTYDPGAIRSWLKGGRIDQLVLVRPGEAERALVRLANRMRVPVVAVLPDTSTPSQIVVRANNREGGRIAGAHLLALGHTNVSFLGGPKTSVDTLDRLSGLRDSLREAGHSLPSARVRFGSDYSAQCGVELAGKWLHSETLRGTSAVVLGNDSLALGFMRGVQAAGLRVPDDVSVMGFDGVAVGALVWPGLTTVAQPVRQMGRDIATRLSSPELSPITLNYDLDLIERESTQQLIQQRKAKSAPPKRSP